MDYNKATLFAATGKILKLPNFEGYFKWDYSTKLFIFFNGDFRCRAQELDVRNRDDWYYIT